MLGPTRRTEFQGKRLKGTEIVRAFPSWTFPGSIADENTPHMAIPELDDAGLLPPGVHDGSLEEVRARFGQFSTSDQRTLLYAELEAFVGEARGTGLVAALIVNGSFTTGKPKPGDVDIIVVLRQPLDPLADLRPDQYNVVSAKSVKARHSFDVFLATAAPESLQPLIDFFSRVRDRPDVRKGMVRVAV